MAVGRFMPSTDTLGASVLARQRSIHNMSSGGTHSERCDGLSCDYPVLRSSTELAGPTFELWLSALAEPQPYLLEPENDRRRALFGELSCLIAVDIEGATQASVAGNTIPDWLQALVTCWNASRAEVITFNYDTLIEATVDSLDLQAPWGPSGDPTPLTSAMVGPSVAPYFRTTFDGPRLAPADTFWYRKLHGSTHWYWDPITRAADSIVQVGIRYRWNERDAAYGDEELRLYRAPGKEPMILPPTIAKSTYFDNPIIRFLWHDAFKALLGARRVFVIGYSLPHGDLLVRSLLADTLSDSDVWIVNPDEEVIERFHGLEVGNLNTQFCGSAFDIDNFATWYDTNQRS
jgi:hypothetical protein